ncbi:GCC2 (predicted) [Pycnogonum litorale]
MNQTNQERETILVEHNNLVSNLRQENGRLSTSLKDQLESSRDNQKKMVSSLQNQLEIADLEIARLRRESRVEIGNNKSTGNVDNFVSTKEEDLVADISLQERQEGEGSENTDTVTSTPHKPSSLPLVHSSGFVPFDQLLQMPVVPASPTNSTMSSLHDAETLAGKLNGYRKKLEHLTEVLNESEATNVRLSEQTIVLKEEIRRLERNEQRRQHSDNLEYLKNIIVKFLTLPVGDERARLIPVFTTMLRLSPEEKSSLAEVAIGNSGGDVTGTSSSGWGLHLWSGLS